MRNRLTTLRWLARLTAVLGAAASVTAQDVRQQAPMPAVDTFGPMFQVTWISALNFSGSPNQGVTLADFGSPADFYTLVGSMGPELYYSELRLPAGAKLAAIQCPVYDTSAAADITFLFFRSRYNPVTKTAVLESGQQFGSSGSSGHQEPVLMVPTPNQMIQYEIGDNWYLYYLQVTVGNVNTRFRGCRLIWQRTVSSAPAMATFNDVPLGHPQRQFIEALAASGITGGCGGGNYCPDAPLTRGQMAVFLSAALGLFWPF